MLLTQCRKANSVLFSRNLGFNSKRIGYPGILNPHTETLTFGQQQQPQDHQERWVTTTTTNPSVNKKFGTNSPSPKYDWNCAVREAERIVGHPTFFVSLRWPLSNEIPDLTVHLHKLFRSSHPFIKTSNYLFYKDKNTTQAWGLIVLLMSKAAGYSSTIPDVEQDKSVGVLHGQRRLVEITEMIRISHLIHNGLVNLQKSSQAGQDAANYEDMLLGNKICLLYGDYLLGQSKAKLAHLRNQDVLGIISSAVRDFAEAEFIGERDEQNKPLPSKPAANSVKRNDTSTTPDIDMDEKDVLVPMSVSKAMGIPDKEWECRNILNGGSLLGKSCQAALNLAKQSEEMQWKAYLIGKHLSLAWQASLDAEPFQTSSLLLDTTFSLVSAPVLFHLEYDHKFYEEIEKGKVSVENVDYAKMHKAILKGPGLEKTKELQRKHTEAAMQVLETFPANDSRTALENITLAMQDL